MAPKLLFAAAALVCWRSDFWMAFLPQLSGHFQGIDFVVLPPGDFVASLMELAMMAAAERHGELVADFHADSARLRKT